MRMIDAFIIITYTSIQNHINSKNKYFIILYAKRSRNGSQSIKIKSGS